VGGSTAREPCRESRGFGPTKPSLACYDPIGAPVAYAPAAPQIFRQTVGRFPAWQRRFHTNPPLERRDSVIPAFSAASRIRDVGSLPARRSNRDRPCPMCSAIGRFAGVTPPSDSRQSSVRCASAQTGMSRITAQRLTTTLRRNLRHQQREKAEAMLRKGATRAAVAKAVGLSASRISAMFKGQTFKPPALPLLHADSAALAELLAARRRR
jgi:hypothetical protein